jgi:two-component system LytT family response regulator
VLRILVVDDEPIARRVLIEELALLPGVDIAGEAENGAEALAEIAALAPDLVFLDLQMPVMTGLEVLQRLGDGRRPIVVVVTAYNQYAREALGCGAAAYLMKPVDGLRLQRTIEDARLRLNSVLRGS